MDLSHVPTLVAYTNTKVSLAGRAIFRILDELLYSGVVLPLASTSKFYDQYHTNPGLEYD